MNPPCVCPPPHHFPRNVTSRPAQEQQADRKRHDLRPSERGARLETGQGKAERHGAYHVSPRVGDPPRGGEVRYRDRCVIVVRRGV